MEKKVLSASLAATMAVSLGTCGDTTTPVPASSGRSGAPGTGKDIYNVTVITKTTDSSYWQVLSLGVKAVTEENNGKTKVATDGPASEIDIGKQVTILENAIAARPDGIVLVSINSISTAPTTEQANAAGIPVVTVDNKLEMSAHAQRIVMDHAIATATAAADMVEQWRTKGIDPTDKKAASISTDSGSAVSQARRKGFTDEVRHLVPNIVVLETQYCDNDIQKVLDTADGLVLVNQDLIGILGGNNHADNDIVKAMEQSKKDNRVVTYALDSDDTEIDAIQNGNLIGIIIQDPFGMGYNGVLAAVLKLEGKDLEKGKVSETTLVTREDIQEDAVQRLLYPGK